MWSYRAFFRLDSQSSAIVIDAANKPNAVAISLLDRVEVT